MAPPYKSNERTILGCFFGSFFFLIFLRLFWLQLLNHSYYEDLLSKQHVSQSLLKAKRGNIFAYDKSGKPVQLTENITLYNVFVDPKFIWNKSRFIDILTPVVYTHLCEMYGMKEMTNKLYKRYSIIREYNNHSKRTRFLLPLKLNCIYLILDFLIEHDTNNKVAQSISWFNRETAYWLIKQQLDKIIQIWIRPRELFLIFYWYCIFKRVKRK